MNYYILLYHELDSPDEKVPAGNAANLGLVVPAERFRQQLECLAALNKPVVSLESILACPEPAPHQGEDRVVLTFDDGHRSAWSLALPALLQAGAVATFYVVSGRVDRKPKSLTSVQLRDLAANKMLIGSHGVTHRVLSEMDSRDLRCELADSRARLEDILGRPVLDLALPGGHFNRAVLEMAREVGYRSVATCKVGIYRLGDDPLRLPRLEIRRRLSLEEYRRTFRPGKVLQLKALEAAKACLRKTVGLSAYGRLRQLVHNFFPLNR